MVSNNEGVLLSPNYPSDYDNSHECVYSIQVQAGKGINISASNFQLAQGDILKVKYSQHLSYIYRQSLPTEGFVLDCLDLIAIDFVMCQLL